MAPRRQAPSPVTSTLASASLIRSRRASAAKPPKTTEWVAPMRAQASIATGSSGTMPRYIATRSPLATPIPFRALAKRQTSSYSAR